MRSNSLFGNVNFKFLGISIILLAVGYILLGQGPIYNHLSWSIAPIILVFAYCILIPVSILYRGKEDSEEKKK
jgi:hypothetical protein